MSYSVYTVELLGSGPINHVRLFVETQEDGGGQIFHVIGTILQGMTFETRSGVKQETDVLFVPGSQIYDLRSRQWRNWTNCADRFLRLPPR